MNVQYKGRQTVNSFGDKLARPLEPAKKRKTRW